jgi:hypothetical protein
MNVRMTGGMPPMGSNGMGPPRGAPMGPPPAMQMGMPMGPQSAPQPIPQGGMPINNISPHKCLHKCNHSKCNPSRVV